MRSNRDDRRQVQLGLGREQAVIDSSNAGLLVHNSAPPSYDQVTAVYGQGERSEPKGAMRLCGAIRGPDRHKAGTPTDLPHGQIGEVHGETAA